MRQLLVEGLQGAFPFIVDRTKPPVIESRENGKAVHRIPGRFSVCDCVNGNNRRYSKKVWEANLAPHSSLQESIAHNAAFGLLEHPSDGLVTLSSPISHQITKAELVESIDPKTGNKVCEVVGEISIYNPELLPESAKILGLIEGGYNPLVSSRGYGSLTKGADGVDEVGTDYVCEGWDIVSKPSFACAQLCPDRTPDVAVTPPTKTAESTSVVPKTNLKESSPSAVPGSSPAPASVTENINMEINELKTHINALHSLDTSKLNKFAESMAQVESMHQSVADWAAADPKRAWESQKLHKELDTIAEELTKGAKQPTLEAKRLAAQNLKCMQIIEAVAKAACGYKAKVGESLKAQASSKHLAEELTRRGQGWQRLAENRKAKYQALDKNYSTACEALDIMAQRYHEDVTSLGRKVLELEFGEKAKTPEIQKALSEATRLRHIVKIREQLEEACCPGGKKPKEGEAPSKEALKTDKSKGAGSPEAAKVAPEPGKVTTESSDPSKPATQITEAKVISTSHDIRDLNESIALVKRLSSAK
jgi:hypothetical protein